MRPSDRLIRTAGAFALALCVLSHPASAADAAALPEKPEPAAAADAPAYAGPLTGYAGTDISLIHSGDKIRIDVYREPDLSGSFVVDSAGKINYRLLGEIFVEGLSLEELRAYLGEALGADYIVNPQIQITFEESPNKSVALLGQVAKPGNYILTPGATLVRLGSQVGGFLPQASTKDVKVVRTDKTGRKTSYIVDVSAIMTGEGEDFKLEPGDLIYVDRVPDKEDAPVDELVTVMGQVARPGNYPLTENLSLIRLVAQAGGFTGVAATHNVRLVRQSTEGPDRVRIVNAGRIMAGQSDDVPLEKGDLIVVQESFF